MRILICGAGRITDELLKRISENWEITLIEKKGEKLTHYEQRFPSVVRLLEEDASSPVVLEKANIREQDCVLAFTDNDQVNLAIVRFAREADVKHVMAMVRDVEMLPEFHKLDSWTLPMSSLMARKTYQFLKDPRVEIFDLGEGEGELMELEVAKQDMDRFHDIIGCEESGWRLVGVLRQKKLLFPDSVKAIQEGDRLLILGRSDLYNEFGTRLKEVRSHFPRTYGQEMILGIAGDASVDVTGLLNEAFYLVQSTHIEKIKAVFEKPTEEIRDIISRWSESLQIELFESGGSLKNTLVDTSCQCNAGVVVVPFTGVSFWETIFGSNLIDMAKKLPCPLLLSRHTEPYKRILVPFNGSLESENALEIAIDLARQIGAEVSVAIVVEPSYLRGEGASSEEWEKQILQQVRDLSRQFEAAIDEQVRYGNPVKEIVAVAEEYQLMVIGRTTGETGLFSLDVTNMLLNKATCSVMLVT